MREACTLCLIPVEALRSREGPLAFLPRWFLEEEERVAQPRRILIDAGLGDELRNEEA